MSQLNTLVTSSMESISIQGRSRLYTDLIAFYNELLSLNPEGRNALMNDKQWGFKKQHDIVKKHTGLSIKFIVNEKYRGYGFNAYAQFPFAFCVQSHGFSDWVEALNEHMAIFPKYNFTKDYRDMLKYANLLKIDQVGTIDLDRGYVTGVFARPNNGFMINMWPDLFDEGRFTAEELAAVCLHEIGHIFHICYWLTRTAAVNIALDAAWNDLKTSKDKEIRVRVVDNTEKALGVQVADQERLAMTDNEEYFKTLFLTSVIKESNSTTGSRRYDMRNAEQFADQFAARHGAARHALVFDDKVNRYYDLPVTWSPAKQRNMLVIRVILNTLLFPIGILVLLVSIGGLFSDSWMDDSYDTPKLRSEKILMQIRSALKNPNLGKEERAELLSDEKVAADILKRMYENESFYSRLWHWVSKKRQDDRDAMNFQIELERLVHNDLFVQSQRLKSLI